MAWRNLSRYVKSLEASGELVRIQRPVDVELEAGCIADLLVKTDGPAVVFEQPRLPVVVQTTSNFRKNKDSHAHALVAASVRLQSKAMR